MAEDNDDIAVYVHFLYCKSRCPYCDFFRGLLPRGFVEDEIVARYLADLARFADLCGKRKVKSVFFGGGTPSLLSPQAVEAVLKAIDERFLLKSDAEITLEANPNTFEQKKFLDFKRAGVNRLSLGVQALKAEGLSFLGRTHGVSEALKAIELGVQAFDKFSIDLIYARPKQVFETWVDELDLALSFGLKHISLYELSIEEGTVFYKKNIEPMDEETAAKLYEQTISYLRERGLERYEVSNFAYDLKAQSIHNLVYWQGGDYIGIGEGAHGRLNYHNGKIGAFVDGREVCRLDAKERAEELVMMGLRLKDGIGRQAFFQASGIELFDFLNKAALKELEKLDLLCYSQENVRLTDKGFLLLDKVILELLR